MGWNGMEWDLGCKLYIGIYWQLAITVSIIKTFEDHSSIVYCTMIAIPNIIAIYIYISLTSSTNGNLT